ncbi:isochorismatase family protein [Teichococcus oryzae]|uniref:Isochorismatase family protein n=1 Tax=Teichococcus oryzae TaxID=1608942 RepID=A0A5B2TEW8_9PROT|nr:isochorismatase family protein [Pseudoroseomonas oryzae]KAA2212997.1 isochorismatase family protein [Pseudoroseomonas oryzae]
MSDKIEKWRGFVPDEELDTYRKAGFGRRIGIGRKPALLNIDTTHMFVEPQYSQCGREMPEMVAALTALTETFRRLGLPIYYSRRDDRTHPTYRGIWNLKLGTAGDFQYSRDPRADEWPAAYAPREEDRIVLKNKPSCFFATPLEAFLRYDEVDTLIICGISTSGCVRAGATDAFQHNFRTILVEEACGDRSPAAHKANLFDLDMKFADVETLDYVVGQLTERFGR